MADLDTLAAGLSRWTKDHDPHVRAAVELLTWHDYWLRRADFAKAAVRWDGTRGATASKGVAWIDWAAAREFADSRPRASTSEAAILDLAVAIGGNQYKLSQMGDAHAAAIVRAFTQALGVEVPGGR